MGHSLEELMQDIYLSDLSLLDSWKGNEKLEHLGRYSGEIGSSPPVKWGTMGGNSVHRRLARSILWIYRLLRNIETILQAILQSEMVGLAVHMTVHMRKWMSKCSIYGPSARCGRPPRMDPHVDRHVDRP